MAYPFTLIVGLGMFAAMYGTQSWTMVFIALAGTAATFWWEDRVHKKKD